MSGAAGEGGIDGAASEGGAVIMGPAIMPILASPGVSGGSVGTSRFAPGVAADFAGFLTQSSWLALHSTMTRACLAPASMPAQASSANRMTGIDDFMVCSLSVGSWHAAHLAAIMPRCLLSCLSF